MLRAASRVLHSSVALSCRRQVANTFPSNQCRHMSVEVLGVQQIAIGGTDKQKLRNLWVDVFGVPYVSTYVSEKENVDEDVLRLGTGTAAVEIDLMQPLDASRAPKVHVPPLNHIGLWVKSLHTAVDELQARGVRFAPGGIRRGASGYDVAFIHPKGNAEFPLSGEGVLIELVDAPDNFGDA